LEDEEKETSGDEVRSDDYKEDEDAEAEEKAQDAEVEVQGSGMAQAEETSEAPSEVPPVQTSVVAATAERAETGSESGQGHVRSLCGTVWFDLIKELLMA